MKRLLTIVACLGMLGACGEPLPVSDGQNGGYGLVGSKGWQGALTISPVITVSGTEAVFEALDVTHLAFDAELFLLPVDRNGPFGDAVDLRFTFHDGDEETVVQAGDLVLADEGRYQVLLRVRQAQNGISVDVSGAITDNRFEALYKAEAEPAPTAARGKDDSEPAPTAAREKEACEPAPTAADDTDVGDDAEDEDGDEGSDECEPAPTAADDVDDDGETYEPAPTAARQDGDAPPASAEPAPTPAEPAPTPARNKADAEFSPGETEDGGNQLTVTSREEFEFFAGEVEVVRGNTELVVAWDVNSWLRRVMAKPLGLDEVEIHPEDFMHTAGSGFDERQSDFDLMCR